MSGPEQRVGGPVADDRARVVAAAKAEALREAAAAWSSPISCSTCLYVDQWLRDRAAAVAAALPTPAPEAEPHVHLCEECRVKGVIHFTDSWGPKHEPVCACGVTLGGAS